jgi:integrase
VPFGNIRLVAEIVTSFFVLEEGIGLSRIAVYNRVKAMGRRAEVNHPVTVHGLRATGATWFAHAGYSLLALKTHFGWKSLKTAEYYLHATGASAVKDMDELGGRIL